MISIMSCTNKNNESKNDAIKYANTETSYIENIAPEEAVKLLKYDKNVMVIDIRKPNDSAKTCKLLGNIVHINANTIEQNPELIPEGKTIILLSKDGNASSMLSNKLSNIKNITIYNLEGGMEAYWKWRENLIREKLNVYDEEINVLDLYSQDFGC